MTDLKLDLAFWGYDRTKALTDGTIAIPGVEAAYHSAPIVTQIFEGMVRGQFQISELGLTYFLRTFRGSESPFVALPVFPNRAFRHSAIYVNKASGIQTPEDLNGKTIGELALYSHDAGIMPKGMLMEEHGFRPETCQWIIGGLDWPMKPIDFVPQPHPANVSVRNIPQGKELGAMLEAGEIDALISADNPRCILENSPKVGRLYADYPTVEREYFLRTGIFPIMHTIVVRKDVLGAHPGLAKTLYEAFCAAKQKAVEKYEHSRIFNNMDVMFPWFSSLIEKDREVLGEDWWPYGIKANRKTLETVLRYHFEQGITEKLYTIGDLFAAELLNS